MKITINTPSGKAEVENVFISELGFLMLKVYLPEQKVWTTYNIGVHDENNNIFTNSIKNVGS